MYFEEEYYEPEEIEFIMDEYKERLSKILKDSAKEEIESILKRNDILNKENETLRDKVKSIERRERDLKFKEETLERDIRRKYFSEIMKDFNTVLYSSKSNSRYIKKCDKCDDHRNLHFKTPLGNDATEYCLCKKSVYIYAPVEHLCTAFKVNRRDGGVFMWYKRNEEKSEDEYFSYGGSDVLKTIWNESMNYNDSLCHPGIYFKTEMDCQKYCDWLNERNLKEKNINLEDLE